MTDALRALAQYAIDKGFIMPEDETWALNRLLEAMQLDAPSGVQAAEDAPLCDILAALTDETKAVKIVLGEAELSEDATVDADKTYYAASGLGYIKVTPAEGDNPVTKGWYEITETAF